MVSAVNLVSVLALSSTALSFGLPSIFSNNYPLPKKPGEKPVPGNSPISICDSTESQLLTLESVVLSPNPPERGQNLTISAIGTLSETIKEGAYVDVDVTYGYIKLIHQTFDLCEEIQNVDMTCPIESGKYTLTKQVEIPKEVPPGKYTVYARAYTDEDEFITCLTGTVEFPPVGLGEIIDILI
ncbi:unnamed protein product [[Candida] boidinii]|nr:hypothetical protein B5S30_g4353 [[Candida] boidinii]OWB84346.1 hypothetical protein B5S33_g2989 [[Candida] boidinii]GMF39455.1 unnamed protein product [[Candida] boidinii]GMF54508.1 unnamed protein product [[Candida] boidinii]